MNHQLEIKKFAIEFSKVDKDGQSKYNHPKCIICRSCYIFLCIVDTNQTPRPFAQNQVFLFFKEKFLLLESLLNSTSAKNVLGSFPLFL